MSDNIAPGCILAETLKPGDKFYQPGRTLGTTDDEKMIIELIQVEVLDGPYEDTTSDPLGRSMIGFRCRRLDTGKEGKMIFGRGGVVRVEHMPPYYVLPEAGNGEQATQPPLGHLCRNAAGAIVDSRDPGKN